MTIKFINSTFSCVVRFSIYTHARTRTGRESESGRGGVSESGGGRRHVAGVPRDRGGPLGPRRGRQGHPQAGASLREPEEVGRRGVSGRAGARSPEGRGLLRGGCGASTSPAETGPRDHPEQPADSAASFRTGGSGPGGSEPGGSGPGGSGPGGSGPGGSGPGGSGPGGSGPVSQTQAGFVLNLFVSCQGPSLSGDVTAGEPVGGASADSQDEAGQDTAVVLDGATDRDVAELLVESVTGLDGGTRSVEMIPEISAAVVTFSNAAEKDRFLAAGRCSQSLQRFGVAARPLEPALSVWVENLSPAVDEEFLELYFDKWTQGKKWKASEILVRPHGVAIVTVGDPQVVKRICQHEDHKTRSMSLKVYPYYESLRCPLYGKDRPAWKMPEPVTEAVEHTLCQFLRSKNLWKTLEDQMEQHFCSLSVEEPVVKLSPLPRFLKQPGLTAERVEGWRSAALRAFRQLLSQYGTFQCPMSTEAWNQAERDVRSAASQDVLVLMDAASQRLLVVGKAEHVKRIEHRVAATAATAMKKIQQKRDEVTEPMELAPTMFHILEQQGLQKAARDISPDLKLSYDNTRRSLTLRGIPADVFKAKSWLLERKFGLSRKQVDLPPAVLDFLRTVDSEDISEELFTSKGTGATYSLATDGILLLGQSDSVLAGAEQKMRATFTQQTFHVEDPGVLHLPAWSSLKQGLLRDSNSPKTTVAILDQGDQVTVVGYLETLKEVSRTLQPFIVDNCRVEEVVRVRACALQFVVKKKQEELRGIEMASGAKVQLDEEGLSFSIAGARFQVLKAKSLLQDLLDALTTDQLVVNKPGAKKYFQANESLFLSSIINDLNCVALLSTHPQSSASCLCRVSAPSGVQLSVSQADLCALQVDAVVNPANENLQHTGGLALALLEAAGPELQNTSNLYVAVNGALCAGQVIATDACRLPCKHVIHAVGPRFSDHSREESVLLLRGVVTQSLREAERLGCTSVAVPAISSGVFGFPLSLCADTIAQAVWEHCGAAGGRGALREVQLVANTEQTAGALATAVQTVSASLGQAAASGGQSHSPRSAEKGGLKKGRSPRGEGHHGDLAEPEGCGLMEGTTAEGLRVVLCKGNIEDQRSCVIVNTISETMNLDQGAVSRALLRAAGKGLQAAVLKEARLARLDQLDPGSLLVTDGFKLRCQKVFHAVCPQWSASYQAEKTLTSIISRCLKEAERLKMRSLSFPAIGTGLLSFPKDLVARVLLEEVRTFSRKKTPQHLLKVFVVVHPSDSGTERSLMTEFSSQFGPKTPPAGSQQPQSSTGPSSSQSQRTSASTFSQVVSTSLGAYQMQMGPLTFEVLSGDITRETCDVIINSSNRDFTLKSGVSKAILDGAGWAVQVECAQQARAQGHPPGHMIVTSAGRLPSKAIVHVFISNNPADIKSTVYAALKLCEEKTFRSAAFPALGTGVGGVPPAAVADAMVGAVADFAKKQPKSIHLAKIVIFQPEMLTHFHNSMMKMQGEAARSKGFMSTIKDAVTSLFGYGEEKEPRKTLVLQKEEFEPAVFQLCGQNKKDVDLAKQRIVALIQKEQVTRIIKDELVCHLTQADMADLESLQQQLTISIQLKEGLDEEEPSICLEGLTRDVFLAEPAIRSLLLRVQQRRTQKHKAVQMSECVEWQYQDPSGQMVAFDAQSNLLLEEALVAHEPVKLKINGETYQANPAFKMAFSSKREEVELLRVDKKAVLPAYWTDMGESLFQLVCLDSSSGDYKDVEQKMTSRGLRLNILKIERVQNVTLWQTYQVLKGSMEKKNGHTNNEKQLFHGTKAAVTDFINKYGFNRGYAGMHGAMYGNGTYFAVDPAYSVRGYAKPDALGHRHMYLARVLVGDFTKGQQSIAAPPARDQARPSDLYDSVTDNEATPSMFVIFHDAQAYPEFLITFT